jgi:hydroxymethylpyrimidine pyrophosphatase-like HAD family hydrolase
MKTNSVIQAFKQGKAKKVKNDLSTGKELFYHNNKIAEYKADGLYISNGGFNSYTRSGKEITGSRTTKERLCNFANIYQKDCQWYLNDKEWDGTEIKISDNTLTNFVNDENYFNEEMNYIRTDGWRGYEEPKYAIAGANNAGNWADSPCKSDICESEIKDIREYLLDHNVPTKIKVCETSNIFCVHVYLIPKVKDYQKGVELVGKYLSENETKLLYKVNTIAIQEEVAGIKKLFDSIGS